MAVPPMRPEGVPEELVDAAVARWLADSTRSWTWETVAKHMLAAALPAYAHVVAEKIRALPVRRCVNDSDGDGDCAACARNPDAPCRQPIPAEQLIASVAGLIDSRSRK